MRRISFVYAAVGAWILWGGGGGAGVWGQMVDSPAGAGGAQMVPGGGVGKGMPVDAGGVAGKTAYVAPSEDEQLSRGLLELKSERMEAAGKYAADDPKLADIDERIATVREKIAARSIVPADEPANDAPADALFAAPMFPRIVQDAYEPPAPNWVVDPVAAGYGVPESTGQRIAADTTQEAPANQAARRRLEQNLREIVAEAQPLEKVLNFLRDNMDANIFVNWTALAAVQVDRNTPVTVSLKDISFQRALTIILAQAGGGTANLSYTIDDGIVTISTREDLSSSKYQEVRVYAVRDLVAVDPWAYPAPFAAQVYDSHVASLCDTIKGAVVPDTWRDSGGTIGSIREFNGMLIINQTADNHRAIETLLAKLRRAR